MSACDNIERTGELVGSIEVNTNGEQLFQNGDGGLAVHLGTAETLSSNQAVVGGCRDGNDDVLMGRNSPVGLEMLVEEDSVDRNGGSSESFGRDSGEPDLLEDCREFWTASKQPTSAIGVAGTVANRTGSGIGLDCGEERTEMILAQDRARDSYAVSLQSAPNFAKFYHAA